MIKNFLASIVIIGLCFMFPPLILIIFIIWMLS